MKKLCWLICLAVAFMLGKSLLLPDEKQLQKRMESLIGAVEFGKRTTQDELVADDYLDRWQLKKSDFLRYIRDFRSCFFTLSIELRDAKYTVSGSEGIVTGLIRIAGKGHGAALEGRVNNQTQPFTFRWRKENWRPWSWILTVVDHPELELPEEVRPEVSEPEGK